MARNKMSYSQAARLAAVGNLAIKGMRKIRKNVRNKKFFRNTPKQQRQMALRMIFGKSSKRKRIAASRVRKRRLNFRGHMNVKTDADSTTKTVYTQKISKKQQRKINRRFKASPSPFVHEGSDQILDTTPQTTNTVKWFWRTNSTSLEIVDAWKSYINPVGTTADVFPTGGQDNKYITNPEQSIYFSKFHTKYELYNPCNYDMNLVIYDIVCKKDTPHKVTECTVSTHSLNGAQSRLLLDWNINSNPIALMNQGNNPRLLDEPTPTNEVAVGEHTNQQWYEIQQNPTDSYPFNTHYKIVGKKILRLQPGATMVHKFTYKPKYLMNRGYWGYNYANLTPNIAIENLTCGTLFKVWGQISGNTTSAEYSEPLPDNSNNKQIKNTGPDEVANLSGRLMIKEWYTNIWYCMSLRGSYHRIDDNDWTPTDEENLQVANDVEIKEADDEDAGGGYVD